MYSRKNQKWVADINKGSQLKYMYKKEETYKIRNSVSLEFYFQSVL